MTKEIDTTQKVDITNFYKRRIKRIIPALLFVIIPTCFVGFLIFTPADLLSLSKSMLYAFFSAANIYFFSSVETGYFAAGTKELPLLHLWSLGVEEQFYILWPFVVLVLLKYVTSINKRIAIVSAVFIGSLVWAQSLIISNHAFAYYMLPTRAWELLGGAIIAFLVQNGFRTKSIINEIMAIVGLSLIILSFIFISELDPVPGVAALPTIIGSALLILSGISHQTYVSRILSLKLLVSVGLVSYSAYLWHWPILSFLRYSLVEIDLLVAICILIFTFILATISYLFIESPLRKNDISTKKVFIYYFILPAIVITSISILTLTAIENKSDFIFPWAKVEQVKMNTRAAYRYSYNCQYGKFDKNAYFSDRCIYPDRNKPTFFLIGDSNAAHYLGMIRVFSDYFGFSVRNATQSSCPLLLNGEYTWINRKYNEGCSIYRHSIKEQAVKYDSLIIGGSWNSYDKQEFKEQFTSTIDDLAGKVTNIILLGKVPLMPGYSKDCALREIKMPWLNCANRFKNTKNEVSINLFIENVAKKYTNVSYFDIRNQLCNGNECSPYLSNKPLYFDDGHLSMVGSKIIGEYMLKNNDPMLKVFESAVSR